MSNDVTQPDWDEGEPGQPSDPAAIAAKTKDAAARLRVLAAEARDLYAVIGESYKFSKTLKPMAKRYAWREEAGLTSVGKDEELRFAARWADERAQIEGEMDVPPLAWSPRAILSAYGTWQAKRGKRKRKLEIQETWEKLPTLYVLDEVEREHPDLANATLLAARKSSTSANGGAVDHRLMIAALQSAMDRAVREYATEVNMSGGKVNVARAVEIEQGARRRAYEHDGDF